VIVWCDVSFMINFTALDFLFARNEH